MKKILILSTCVLWYFGTFAQEVKKIAVFDPAGNVSVGTKAITREEISNVIVNTKGYAVLERSLIEKVLEENKFQMGGLVDDSQIGEIGKKMGANAVFVTSITPIGSNFYISFKLIDVQTARIEMQKTGKTTKGEGDIDVVVQKVVGEMFSGVPNTTVRNEPEQSSRSVTTAKKGGLLADGMDVYSNGNELSKNEVRNLLANTDALRLYNKGVDRRKTGTIFFWTGVSLFTVGIVLAAMSSVTTDNGYGYSEEYHEYEFLAVPGAIGISTGIALTGIGIGFRISGKSQVRKAVDKYNNQQYSSNYTRELQFGITRNGGIGLAYNF